MVKNKELKVFLFFFALASLYFLPFLIKPSLLFQKDNDLGRNYVPIYSFIRQSFWENKSLPLWNPNQLMGETFIGNPLSTILYPFNIIFIIFPVSLGVFIYYILHLVISLLSTFLLAKTFSLSNKSSVLAAVFYTFSIKMLLHISAGHITMVAAFSFFPLLFLATRKLLSKPNCYWQIIFSLTVYAILVTYATIFYYAFLFIFFYCSYFAIFHNAKKSAASLISILFALIVGILLSAVFLLPQIEFAKYSTRSHLTLQDVAIPLWNFKKFVQSLTFPYHIFSSLNHEEFLYLGAAPTILSLMGFLKLTLKRKIVLILLGFLTIVFILGLSTPIFKYLYEYFPLLGYSRVTTRPWFVVALLVSLVSAFAVDKFKLQRFLLPIIAFFSLEVAFIGYAKIINTPSLSFSNESMYEYLNNDRDIFRVYCTSNCFNAQLLTKHRIQILNGENPLQIKKSIDFLEKAGNYSFQKYAVIFPPYQVWQVENPPQPDANLLGLANVKYVASVYQLTSDNFVLVDKFSNVYLYQNLKYQKLFYFLNDISRTVSVQKFSPNDIILSFPKSANSNDLAIFEVDYPGWSAYMDNRKVSLTSHLSYFKKITVPPNTSAVKLKFEPSSLLFGKTISLTTLLFIIIYACYISIQKKNGKYRNT